MEEEHARRSPSRLARCLEFGWAERPRELMLKTEGREVEDAEEKGA